MLYTLLGSLLVGTLTSMKLKSSSNIRKLLAYSESRLHCEILSKLEIDCSDSVRTGTIGIEEVNSGLCTEAGLGWFSLQMNSMRDSMLEEEW